MKKMKWDLNKSLSFVTAKRIVAKPNDGFMRQLVIFNNELKAESSRIQQSEP